MGSREMEPERRFFHRLSSAKVEYEKAKRRTLEQFQSHRQSTLPFFQPKEQISQHLRDTLRHQNWEDLYVEILCLLFPTAESRQRPDSGPLLQFLQTAFNFDSTKHKTLMDIAKAKKMRGRVLHLEVLEAKDLAPKDLNGLSDPFCTLYVTNKDRAQRTRVVLKSLHPIWNDKINDPQKDFLRIDIWDQDPAERMRDKLKRVGEIKSPSSAYNFIREVAHGRDSSQEFMGKVEIAIREVSSETMEKWVGVSEGSGEIYLRMTLGVEAEGGRRDFRAALHLLALREVDKEAVPFHWDYRFPPWATYLLRQLRNGWGLKPQDELLAKWLALLPLHLIFPLQGPLIHTLAQDLFTTAHHYNAQEVSLMWKAAEEFVIFATTFVKNLHEIFHCSVTTSQLYHILKTLEVFGKVEGTDSNTFISKKLIRTRIQEAVAKGASYFFQSLLDEHLVPPSVDSENADPVQSEIETLKILKLGQLLNFDLRKGQEVVDMDLKFILGVDYHSITYQVYDNEYGKIVKPLVSKYCSKLKSLSESQGVVTFLTNNKSDSPESTFAINFFHLYLSIKQFATYSGEAKGSEGWVIAGSFHEWFFPGLTHLLDLLGQMWKGWMGQAVKLDYEKDQTHLIPYKTKYKITTSSFDSIEIICAIQNFWVSLSWPNPEQALIIVEKVLKELCGFSICYANFVSDKLLEVEGKTLEKAKTYTVSIKLCRSINNIEHVGSYTRELGGQLNLKDILASVSSTHLTESDILNKQLEIQRAGLDGVIQDILTKMAAKMGATIYVLLQSILEEKGSNPNNKLPYKAVDDCLAYYKDNLEIIAENMIAEYYEEAVGAIWNQTLICFNFILNQGLKNQKSWEYFWSLREILEIVRGFLESGLLLNSPKSNGGSLGQHNPKQREIYKLLDKYGMSTAILKMEYYKRRVAGQTGGYGMITIRSYYQKTKEVLYVEILNARNIKPADSDGQSDPYVEILVVPSEDFLDCGRHCTKVVKKTLYPLFEESFSIGMKPREFARQGFLQFSLFDHDFMLRDDLLGEAFFSLREISVSDVNISLGTLPQKHLSLSIPTETDVAFLDGLIGSRTWEKELSAFQKREKEKLQNHGLPTSSQPSK